MIKLQVINGQSYWQHAKRNAEKTYTKPHAMGKVLDRTGQVIIDSCPCYNLILKAGERKSLTRILNFLEENNIVYDHNFLKKQQNLYPLWHPLMIIYDIDQETLTQLSFHLHSYPEITIETSTKRVYKQKKSWGSITGYLKQDSIRKTYHPLSGVEKYFHNYLSGHPSSFEVIKTAKNKVNQISKTTHGSNGRDLTLTINSSYQNFGYQLFSKYSSIGSLVALCPKTGEILALVSAPGFDASDVQKNMSKLSLNPDKPLFNRSLQGLYPPASLLKPVIALAALEENIITKHSSIFDPGYYTLEGSSRKYRDWKASGHGQVNIEKAIRESCDTFFYDLGFKLGIDRMSKWLDLFGFGQPVNSLGLPNEKGLLPSRQWKLKAKKEPWYKGESLITAIGQGYLSATPLQLAYMCSFFANKGYSYSPSLLHSETKEPRIIELENKEIWDIIHSSLVQVVHNPKGTAYRKMKRFKNLHIAGKTGTAQVVSLKMLKSNSHIKEIQDHSLFMGYAPYENPEIVIVVISEHKPTALLIAGEFLDYVFSPGR